MRIIHGRNLILSIDGVAVAMSKSCTLTVNAEIIETSSPEDGAWQRGVRGMMSWSVKTNSFVSSVAASVAKVGMRVRLSLQPRDDSEDRVTGWAWITTGDFDFTTRKLGHGSYAFRGDGKLDDPSRLLLSTHGGEVLTTSDGEALAVLE